MAGDCGYIFPAGHARAGERCIELKNSMFHTDAPFQVCFEEPANCLHHRYEPESCQYVYPLDHQHRAGKRCDYPRNSYLHDLTTKGQGCKDNPWACYHHLYTVVRQAPEPKPEPKPEPEPASKPEPLKIERVYTSDDFDFDTTVIEIAGDMIAKIDPNQAVNTAILRALHEMMLDAIARVAKARQKGM